jgi:hypothetical protein
MFEVRALDHGSLPQKIDFNKNLHYNLTEAFPKGKALVKYDIDFVTLVMLKIFFGEVGDSMLKYNSKLN